MRLDTLYLDPWVQRAQKGGPGGVLEPLQWILRALYQTKVAGHANLVGVGHLFGPKIRIWKHLGPVCFWSHRVSLLRRVYKI